MLDENMVYELSFVGRKVRGQLSEERLFQEEEIKQYVVWFVKGRFV